MSYQRQTKKNRVVIDKIDNSEFDNAASFIKFHD
jgi:hypothetical protein